MKGEKHTFRIVVHSDKSAPELEFADSFGALQVLPLLQYSKVDVHVNEHPVLLQHEYGAAAAAAAAAAWLSAWYSRKDLACICESSDMWAVWSSR